MPSASAPFKAKAPFHSRVLGLNYESFGLDFINPPFPTSFGCLFVSPTIDLNVSGPEGGPFSPASSIYTITNTGATTMDWTLVSSQAWLVPDLLSGTLLPGESQNINIAIDADWLPQSPTPYTATLTFTNTTNGCGDSVSGVNLSITGDMTLDIEERTKGGMAVLCGYDEYTTPSVPPKKYRVRTFSGTGWDFWNYVGTVCGGVAGCHSISTISGSCYYDEFTCDFTSNGFYTVSGSTHIDCGTNGTYPICSLTPLAAFGDFEILTQTTKHVDTLGTCFANGGQSAKRTYMDVTETLSVEDTETSAQTRILASSSYTAWAPALAQGDALSEYQARTSGFNFVYQTAQWRVSLGGLAPSTLYNGSAIVYRRLRGSSDPWISVSTEVISGTTDGSGNFAAGPYDLPNARGYEYTVWNAGLTP